MKYFIAGDTGLLGKALVRHLLKDKDALAYGFSTSSVPASVNPSYLHRQINAKTEFQSLRKWMDEVRPDVVINCMALVDLIRCEQDQDLARDMHVHIPGKLAQTTEELSGQFVQISTDQVFDGNGKQPYTESDPANPMNNYGRTKWEGERVIMKAYASSLVLRTNIVGFRDIPGKPTFSEWLFHVIADKVSGVTLFDDYWTSSIHVSDFSHILKQMLNHKMTGLWHVASRDASTKYRFGKDLAGELNLDFSHIRRGSLKDANLKPPRPSYLALSVERVEKALKEELPESKDTIRRIVNDIEVRREEK